MTLNKYPIKTNTAAAATNDPVATETGTHPSSTEATAAASAIDADVASVTTIEGTSADMRRVIKSRAVTEATAMSA